MILNLEAEEAVNRSHGFRIGTGYSNAGSIRHVFDAIFNLVPQLFHRGDARRRACVDQHRSVEVALAEHGRNVLQVFADLLSAGGVRRVVRNRLDHAAVVQEPKVVRGLVMRKAHNVISAVDNPGMMRIGGALRKGQEWDEQDEDRCNQIFHDNALTANITARKQGS